MDKRPPSPITEMCDNPLHDSLPETKPGGPTPAATVVCMSDAAAEPPPPSKVELPLYIQQRLRFKMWSVLVVCNGTALALATVLRWTPSLWARLQGSSKGMASFGAFLFSMWCVSKWATRPDRAPFVVGLFVVTSGVFIAVIDVIFNSHVAFQIAYIVNGCMLLLWPFTGRKTQRLAPVPRREQPRSARLQQELRRRELRERHNLSTPELTHAEVLELQGGTLDRQEPGGAVPSTAVQMEKMERGTTKLPETYVLYPIRRLGYGAWCVCVVVAGVVPTVLYYRCGIYYTSGYHTGAACFLSLFVLLPFTMRVDQLVRHMESDNPWVSVLLLWTDACCAFFAYGCCLCLCAPGAMAG